MPVCPAGPGLLLQARASCRRIALNPTARGRSADCTPYCLQPFKMAKSKNHTAHNQTAKAHRNGLKKPQTNKYKSNKGVSHRLYYHSGLIRMLTSRLVLLRSTPSSSGTSATPRRAPRRPSRLPRPPSSPPPPHKLGSWKFEGLVFVVTVPQRGVSWKVVGSERRGGVAVRWRRRGT